jgi:hypothetical protein
VLSVGGPSLPPLEPPYAAALTELAIRCINRPQAAILIPQILQDTFWRALGATGLPPSNETNFLAGEKLTQDLLDFLKTASEAPWSPRVQPAQPGCQPGMYVLDTVAAESDPYGDSSQGSRHPTPLANLLGSLSFTQFTRFPIAARPDLRLSLDNLRTRCNACHSAKTMRESVNPIQSLGR